MTAGDIGHPRGLLRDDGWVAIRLHEQQRFTVERKADLRVVFHAVNGGAIQEFERARDNLRFNDR